MNNEVLEDDEVEKTTPYYTAAFNEARQNQFLILVSFYILLWY